MNRQESMVCTINQFMEQPDKVSDTKQFMWMMPCNDAMHALRHVLCTISTLKEKRVVQCSKGPTLTRKGTQK